MPGRDTARTDKPLEPLRKDKSRPAIDTHGIVTSRTAHRAGTRTHGLGTGPEWPMVPDPWPNSRPAGVSRWTLDGYTTTGTWSMESTRRTRRHRHPVMESQLSCRARRRDARRVPKAGRHCLAMTYGGQGASVRYVWTPPGYDPEREPPPGAVPYHGGGRTPAMVGRDVARQILITTPQRTC